MNTFYEMWGAETPDEVKNIIESQRFKGTPKNLEEQALSMVGTDIYEALIKDILRNNGVRKQQNSLHF